MSIHHHPSDALLLDYASGALAEGWALAIATHLALCPNCRARAARFDAVGGNLLEELPPIPAAADTLEAVLARLDEPEPEAPPARARAIVDGRPILPEPLRGYVGGDVDELQWRRLGRGAYHFVIATAGKQTTARLLRIPAGRPVPQHSHNGLELTLVLCGAFSDQTGRFGRGDLQEADGELTHQPHAEPGEDCICLAITDAPLRFRSWAARLVQPFLGI